VAKICEVASTDLGDDNAQDVISVHAHQIISEDPSDLTVLLALVNTSDINSTVVWDSIGLQMNGKGRGRLTTIAISKKTFMAAKLNPQTPCIQPVLSRLARKAETAFITAKNQEAPTLAKPTPFEVTAYKDLPIYQRRLSGVAAYIDRANARIVALETELRFTREAVEVLKARLAEQSQLAKMWLLHKARAGNSNKHPRTEADGFMAAQQSDHKIGGVVNAGSSACEEPLRKKQVLGEVVQEACNIPTPAHVPGPLLAAGFRR
jgi:hypothetical protein